MTQELAYQIRYIKEHLDLARPDDIPN